MNFSAFAVLAAIVGYFLYYAARFGDQYLCLGCGYRFGLDILRPEPSLVCPYCGGDDVAPAPFSISNQDYIAPLGLGVGGAPRFLEKARFEWSKKSLYALICGVGAVVCVAGFVLFLNGWMPVVSAAMIFIGVFLAHYFGSRVIHFGSDRLDER